MKDVRDVIVTLEPVGRRVTVAQGCTLLEAAQAAGVALVAVCGGVGACSGCRVRLVSGSLTPVTLEEEAEIEAELLAAGWRMACQAELRTDVVVDVPPESLTAPQRLLIEGETARIAIDPVVLAADVVLEPADLTDLRADVRRLLAVLPATASVGLAAMRDLPNVLRAHDWRARVALRGGAVVAVLPPAARLLGLAADVGTTSLAAYLVDLETGETAAKAGAMNPQIAYGEDVISRIVYCSEHAGGRDLLQSRLIETLNGLIDGLCAEVSVDREQIVEVVLVGNTVMHHLTLGLPVRSLGEAPYVPAVDQAVEVLATQIGLNTAAGAPVYLPPNIAGYVGADHVAALVATGIIDMTETALVVDIGTNTEMTLTHGGRRWSCSCASGPAFEGAHIRHGMRAAPGAIERVQIIGGRVRVQTIGGQAASGVCGSGILDAVAEMTRAGLLDARGAFVREHPLAQNGAFVLAGAEESSTGQPITIDRRDVAEIQLAKAAIRAGVDLLLAEAGIAEGDLHSFIIAGAFGTYIQVASAVEIGMFPALPLDRFHQVGNAAGMGACHMLISQTARAHAAQLAQHSTYVELTTHEGFRDAYMARMALA